MVAGAALASPVEAGNWTSLDRTPLAPALGITPLQQARRHRHDTACAARISAIHGGTDMAKNEEF